MQENQIRNATLPPKLIKAAHVMGLKNNQMYSELRSPLACN